MLQKEGAKKLYKSNNWEKKVVKFLNFTCKGTIVAEFTDNLPLIYGLTEKN